MSNFEIKYRVGSAVKTAVVSASDEAAAGRAFSSSNHDVSPGDVIGVLDLSKAYRSDYGAAKFIGMLISSGGWVIVVLGIVGAAGGFIAMGSGRELGLNPVVVRAVSMLIMMFSLLYSLVGLFMVAAGQHFRAAVDTANYNGEMLALMKLARTSDE